MSKPRGIGEEPYDPQEVMALVDYLTDPIDIETELDLFDSELGRYPIHRAVERLLKRRRREFMRGEGGFWFPADKR